MDLHSMLLHYYHYHHKCHTYVELQRESEVSKLRKDLEECNIQDRTQKMIYIFSTLNCSPSDSSSARRWMVKLPHWVELA